MQGWADPPLSADGEAHARALGRELADGSRGTAGPVGEPEAPGPVGDPAATHLARGSVVAVASSDLARAVRTAQLVGEACGCPAPVTDARLREREIGWLTGLTDEEARRLWPAELSLWRQGLRARPPGGESGESILRRARAALDALARRAAEVGSHGVVVVVSHGGLMSVVEREAGAGPGGFANLCGRWVLVEEGGWRLGDRFSY